MNMFYLSALVAIAGAVGYQYFVKQVPENHQSDRICDRGMYVVVLGHLHFSLAVVP